MKFKRIVAGFSASFDELVGKIENHEAVAAITLQEIRAAAAKIRTQLNLTRQRIEQLQQREQRLLEDCALWQNRAQQCGADKERALRCVQALEQAEQQKMAAHRQIQENLRLQKELHQYLEKVEQRLSDLQLKRDSLSARAARNKVVLQVEQAVPGADPDRVFARWEERVLTDEYATQTHSEFDADQTLDAEFRAGETQRRLEARLASLVADAAAKNKKEI